MVRTPCCEKTGLKKGAWTVEEDRKLEAYIKRYGHWNWRELPKFAGLSRCGKSCRLRWMNYLRPNLKRGNYSKEEEEIIINSHQSLGNRWAAIAAKLPGRTDNEIKNHWHTNLKKRLKQNSTASEANLQSGKNSESESNSKRESEADHFLPNAPTNQTLESSPSSPQPSLSDLSSMSTDSAVVTSTNWVGDENTVSSDNFAEPNGDFWTEPFLAGNSFIQEDFLEASVDEGLMFPFSPVSVGESLSTYGFYNYDGVDWFS